MELVSIGNCLSVPSPPHSPPCGGVAGDGADRGTILWNPVAQEFSGRRAQ